MNFENFTQQPESSSERENFDPKVFAAETGENLAAKVIALLNKKYANEQAQTIHQAAEKLEEAA